MISVASPVDPLCDSDRTSVVFFLPKTTDSNVNHKHLNTNISSIFFTPLIVPFLGKHLLLVVIPAVGGLAVVSLLDVVSIERNDSPCVFFMFIAVTHMGGGSGTEESESGFGGPVPDPDS